MYFYFYVCACIYACARGPRTGAAGGCGLSGVDVEAGIQTLDVPKAARGLNSLALNLKQLKLLLLCVCDGLCEQGCACAVAHVRRAEDLWLPFFLVLICEGSED